MIIKMSNELISSNIKIIYIDDDPFELESFKSFFNFFNVSVFVDPLEAYNSSLTKEKFDFIFLDLYMPRLDGVELCRRIRNTNLNSEAYIYSCTSETNKNIQYEMFKAGFDDVIEKPINHLFIKGKILATIKRKFNNLSSDDITIKRNRILLEKDFNYYLDGKKTNITSTEFEILNILSKNEQKCFDSYDIYYMMNNSKQKDYNHSDGIASVRMHIANIRKKLFKIEPELEFIKTIRNKGYLLMNLDII